MAHYVAIHDHFCGCFARGVWVCWLQHAGLSHISGECLAVHLERLVCFLYFSWDQTNLVRGDVIKSPDLAIRFDALQQDVRAAHIVHRKDVRVAETQIDMRVRSEVEHGVDVVFLQTLNHVGRYRHVAMEEAEVTQLPRLQHTCIVE